ncbi:hypothetical protein [Roseovarius sp. D22-M7]|uniref:hypothetical protein n=1 Tax=Roseovarius sp. D22-M7 TaxID=3127116 RepID=UPI00300FDF80
MGLALSAASCAAARAHTPYGQWVAYRQKHLLIGAHRGDGRTYELAQAVVAALETELPEARARIARGPRPQRIASLMGTGQLFVSVLSAGEAETMVDALPPFENYTPTPLRILATLDGNYHVFATPDLPEDHAWLVTRALDHAQLGHRPALVSIPLHPGASAFWDGSGMPG